MSDAGIKDVDALLALTEKDILKRLNCSEKSADEITALQNKYRSKVQDITVPMRGSPQKRKAENAAMAAVGFPGTVSFDKKSSASACLSRFDQVVAPLSDRARNILMNAGIRDLTAFLSFKYHEILKCPNCNKKTADQILDYQIKLLSPPQQETAVAIPFSFDDVPIEVFDAIREKLSFRAVGILRDLAVYNLQAFMDLTQNTLLNVLNCGADTANHILDLQFGIAKCAREQVIRDGVFRPECLLNAPCLICVEEKQQSGALLGGLCRELDNPAPWLVRWIRSLAHSERHACVFMLRMGMLGSAPMSLESVAQQIGGVTPEQVSQMQQAVEKDAAAFEQERGLFLMVNEAANIVAQRGGSVSLEELTEAVLGRGKDGGQLRQATALLVFFSRFRIWREAGLRPPTNGIVCTMRRYVENRFNERLIRPAGRSKVQFSPPEVAKREPDGFDPDDLKI